MPQVRGDSPQDRDRENAWTEVKNSRRCDLIDREIEGTLGSDEAEELRLLQEEMLHYRRRVAPLPLDAARKLWEELVHRSKTDGQIQ